MDIKRKKVRIYLTGGNDFSDYDYLVRCMESVYASGLLDGQKIILSDGKPGPGIWIKTFVEEEGCWFVENYTASDVWEVADVIVVFWNGELQGIMATRIEAARKRGIPVWVFPYDEKYNMRRRKEVGLHALEYKWQQEQAKERERLAELEGESFSFKRANNIELDCLKKERENKPYIEEDNDEDFWAWCRHGMSKEEWAAYNRIIDRQQRMKWKKFAPWEHGDYDYEEIFTLLKFKLERMVDYMKQFSHCTNGEYIQQQLETACRLLNIIIKYGNENGDCDVFPYRVNMRNAHRFEANHCGRAFINGEPQEVRYNKAFCIFFKYLERNIHRWWD